MRRLMIFALGFTAAVIAYIWLLPSETALLLLPLCLLVAFISCFFFSKRSDHPRRVRLAALGAAMGLLWTWGYEQLEILPVRALAGETVAIQGQVIEVPTETDYGCFALCRMEKGRIALYLDCPAEEIQLGDCVSLTADVIDVSQDMADEQGLYYQSMDIDLLGLQNGTVSVERPEKLPFSLYPAALAHKLRTTISEAFPRDVEGFVRALLTGDKSGLSYSVLSDLSASGISHVVAVSGMHVSLLTGMILSLFGKRRTLAVCVCSGVILFFAAMLGFAPSVSRAVVMNCVLLYAPLFRRENDLLTSLSMALLAILLCNPWSIANVSFQLSFAAMAGIVLLTPTFYGVFARYFRLKRLKENESPLYKPLSYIATVMGTSIGSAIATTPILVHFFGGVSLVAPVTNLLTMCVISTAFPAAFLASLAGMLWLPLGKAMGWLVAWPIRYVLWIAKLLGGIPNAVVYTDSTYILAWIITAYALLGVYLRWWRSCRQGALSTCLLITLIGAILVSGFDVGTGTLTAVDVGQGQCIVLRSGGQTALIDCGGDQGDENGDSVAKKLMAQGENRVDAVILTHFDQDHVCGLEQLMKRLDVVRLYVPDIQQGEESRETVLYLAQKEGAEVVFVTVQTELTLGNYCINLYPPTDRDVKNASLAALLSLKEYDILVTGDMTSDQERKLLARYDFPDIEVLFAGHHGSKYSTCAELLEATAPETVIICVGENTYGHPTAEVLERIAAIGAEVYRTDLCGDITITR